MLSYTRGVIVAYRDVLDVIDQIDFEGSDPKLGLLKDHIEDRILNYLERQIPEGNID